MEKVDIEVGTVDHRVAARTVSGGLKTKPAVRYVGGNWIDVARQAQEPFFPAHQEHAVYTAVGCVTDNAPFDLYSRMLEYEWTALFDVALDARLPAGLA